jgi:hypothetical protein
MVKRQRSNAKRGVVGMAGAVVSQQCIATGLSP